MIQSLLGDGAYVDLCEKRDFKITNCRILTFFRKLKSVQKAINDELIFSLPVAGQPPIEGTAMGIPAILKSLVTIAIDQNYPV